MTIMYISCAIVFLSGCAIAYFRNGGGATGIISAVLVAVMVAAMLGAISLADNINEKRIKKEFIALNENIIKNKKILNEDMKFIEESPYLSDVNNKQKLVDLQSVYTTTCNVIKKNLLTNIDNKYKIKDIVINNNDKKLCKSGNANRIQYILEVN